MIRSSCLFLIFLVLASPALAQIYKYQDADGRWHYTDKPPKQDSEVLELRDQKPSKASKPAPGQDIAKHLEDLYHPETDIEKSTLAVVKIEAPLGTGSGFFISDDGYIVTNKHVVKPMDMAEFKKLDAKIKKDSAHVKEQKARIRSEEKSLKEIRKWLKEQKRQLDDKPEVARHEYEMNKSRYEARKANFDYYKAQFDEFNTEFEKNMRKWRKGKSRSRAAQSFVVILKDDSKLKARLIKSSDEHDLALLKLRGEYSTPFLTQAQRSNINQGMEVFAIGSPLGFKDYVTRGVLTSYQSDTVVTDAQILPGNSGGPLVTPEGDVIGVNTQRVYAGKTVGSEGFGLAIPYRRIEDEFGKYLDAANR